MASHIAHARGRGEARTKHECGGDMYAISGRRPGQNGLVAVNDMSLR